MKFLDLIHIYRIITARFGAPRPSFKQFDGLSILLIGASGGMGLAASKKLAAQGTSILYITARDKAKGDTAKAEIETYIKLLPHPPKSMPKVVPLVLEMSSPASIRAFVHSLKQHTNHLDHAIISAGVIESEYYVVDTGFEKSLQINGISPVYLALLLLPLLLASPLTTHPNPRERPHLISVSSGSSWFTDIDDYCQPITERPLVSLSQPDKFPPGRSSGRAQYGRTKMVLEDGFRRVAFLPSISNYDGTPKVLVHTVCPGAVATDIGRQHAQDPVIKTIAWLVNNIIARSADVGCNIYISGLSTNEGLRGEMWQDDTIVNRLSQHNMNSNLGREYGLKIWLEMKDVLRKFDETNDEAIVNQLIGE